MPPKEKASKSKHYLAQFIALLAYLRVAPKAVLEIFTPYVVFLKQQKFRNHEVPMEVVESLRNRNGPIKLEMTDSKKRLFDNILRMLDLESFCSSMIIEESKFVNFLKAWERHNEKEYSNCYSQSIRFDLSRPEYYLTELIAKFQGQNSIGQRFKDEYRKNSPFYKQPRFIDKLYQLRHFRSHGLHRGQIALLEYNGNFIQGNRIYAVAKDNRFDIYQKVSDKYPYPFYDQNGSYIDSSSDSDQYESSQSSAELKKKNSRLQLERSFRFIGHSSKITCASLSQDELYILTGSADKTVKLWCLRLNILLATYKGHYKTVWDVHFNPSGLYFLSGGADGLMILWKTDSNKPQRIFVHKSDIYKVHFARNPSFAISGGEECMLKIWDIVKASVVATIRTDNPIINFNLGHSGIYIVVVEIDGRVTIHDTTLGKVLSSFYFYFKLRGEAAQSKQIIHDVCLSDDQKDLVCVTSKHILLYSITSLQMSLGFISQTSTDSKGGPRQKIVAPYLVLMSASKLRFTFCRFRHRNLLVVGGTKHNI